jgi:hypothetical protein
MSPKGKPREEVESVIRTSVELPETLWHKAKQRALDERTDLRALIIRGLELILARKPKKGGK